MQQPQVAPAPPAEAVEQAELPMATPNPAAEAVEQAELHMATPAPAAEAVEQVELPMATPTPAAEAVEQAELYTATHAQTYDAVEQFASLVDPTMEPAEPAQTVPAALPDPMADAPHWAMATYDEGMTVDDAGAEPLNVGSPAPGGSARPAESAAAAILESVAARLRQGEIVLAAEPSGSETDAAVLAAVLSALLRTHR